MPVVEVDQDFWPDLPPPPDDAAEFLIGFFEQVGRRQHAAFAFANAILSLKRIAERSERLSQEDCDRMLGAVARAYMGVAAEYPGYPSERLVPGINAINWLVLYAADDRAGRSRRKAAWQGMQKRAQILQNDFWSEDIVLELNDADDLSASDFARLAPFRDALRDD